MKRIAIGNNIFQHTATNFRHCNLAMHLSLAFANNFFFSSFSAYASYATLPVPRVAPVLAALLAICAISVNAPTKLIL